MFENECLYIGGPACFYKNGYDLWFAMRKQAEYLGFTVSMPTEKELFLQNEDLRKNADTIFANCCDCMNRATIVIADLEFYRGTEPDGGTMYEIGMGYAKGCRCYGFTRDKRNMVWKHQNAVLRNGSIYDETGRIMPYPDLPFSPTAVSSMKIIEGDFDDCMKLIMLDIEEECKNQAKRTAAVKEMKTQEKKKTKNLHPFVYLSEILRYDSSDAENFSRMKEICADYGLEAVCPTDQAKGVKKIDSDNPYTKAFNTFDNYQQHVRDCDILIANLNGFHGWEPSSEVAFECGMAFQLGKRLFGYKDDTSITRKSIPNYGESGNFLDMYGNIVENFNYPMNLMFSSSMPIFEGNFESTIKKVAEALLV
ncbi:MAG: nucleoside 2-deoxyribosyltransferase [Flexilinea sp.]